MSEIRTSISIADGVSSPAAKMANALNDLVSTFERAQRASEQTIDPTAWNESLVPVSKLAFEMEEVAANANKAEAAQENLNKKIREGEKATSSLLGSFKSIASTIGIGLGIREIVNLADSMTLSAAKLNLINNGPQTTDQLQNKIFESANRARASYQSTADAVARLGANAKQAFSSTDEIIAFAEQVNKHFVLSGTEAGAAAGAMTQLTQALGSGVLRGDELNSIFEAAPTMIQAIAKEMDVNIGQIRTLAAEGKISASIVKNAMLNAAQETNEKFDSIPITFEQLWQKIKNNLLKQFKPLLQTIGKASDWIADHWGVLEPIFYGLAAAIGATTIATKAFEFKTRAAAIAQGMLNKAMLASPFAWIGALIGALVSGITMLSQAVGGFGNLWTLVCGYAEAGWNYLVFGILWGADKIKTAMEAVALFFYRIWFSIEDFMDNVWAGIVSGAEWCVNQLIDALNTIAKIMNPVLGALSQDGMIIKHARFSADVRANMDQRIANRNALYEALEATADRNRKIRQVEIDTIHAWATNAVPNAWEKVNAVNAAAAAAENGEFNGGIPAENDLQNNVVDIAENTARMADSLESAALDLTFLRELAERRAVSQYTNANVTLDMTGMQNTFTNDMDVDGFVEIIAVKLDEAINSSAEGVHW